MVSILLLHGTLLTMDSQRGLIQDGAVAIDKTRIIDIGPTKELADSHDAQVTIDATGKVIMPGLIDTHGHAGHSLVKTVAEDR
ncbi:MAG: amidohydrolase family protein, partial [Candidatus Hodarchaeales archaeon]